MVSLYPNIHTTTGGAEVNLQQVFEGIRTGRWREQVELVRAAETVTEKRRLKKQLPYFTVSGTFTKRSEAGLVQHSGLVCLDIDHDLSMREEIGADPYTYAMFVSTGGDGLAVIVRIPTDNHNASYKALKRYYEETYGISSIDSLPDVSRPRFVSYDPEVFINEESQVFTQQLVEPEHKPAARPQVQYPAPTKPASHGQAALQTAVRKILEAPAGDKHHTRKRMSYLCGGYVATGLLSEHEAQEALEDAVRQTSPASAWKDAFSTIRSGLKKGAEKPILPEPLEYIVRTGKRHGEQKELVAQKIIVSNGGSNEAIQQVVESIYAEPELTILAFWDVAYDDKKDKYTLLLSKVKYTRFLEEAGFRKMRQGARHVIVRKVNNIVEEASRAEIKDYIMGYLSELPFEFDNVFRAQLIDQVMKEHRQFFDEGMLEFLSELPDQFLRDSKAVAYFFFRNGFVTVKGQAVELQPYDALPGLIWAEQVVDRDFEPLDMEEVNEACDFYTFLFNISGQNTDRLTTLATAIGYLLHGYKAPSNPKVVALVDEAISEVPQGGTGKSLVFQAIGKMRQMVTLDGKNIDFKDRFVLQEVTPSTRVLFFDDWDGKRLSFDKLFVMATGEMKLHKMYIGAVTIPYSESAKIGVATNDMLGGEGSSHARRKLEIEIAPHYSDRLTPLDEFGHEFFTDWSEADWNIFDNLMVGCCQMFLQKGLKSPKAINLNRRKLLQGTNSEFVAFCDELKRGQVYYKKVIWGQFIEAYGFDPKSISQVKFTRWLKTYANMQELQLEEGRNEAIGDFHREQFFILSKP